MPAIPKRRAALLAEKSTRGQSNVDTRLGRRLREAERTSIDASGLACETHDSNLACVIIIPLYKSRRNSYKRREKAEFYKVSDNESYFSGSL